MTEQQIPEGWQMVKFGDIAKHISKRVEPSETDLEIYVGLEHLDPDSLKIKRHGVPSDVEGQKLLVKKGQIIFGKRRAYQRKVAVADWDCICSAHAMVLEAIPGKIIPEFLPHFMQSQVFMDRAVAISEGSLSPTIKWKVLAGQSFMLPSKEDQLAVIYRLKAVLDVLEKSQDLLTSSDRFYYSLTKEIYEKSGKSVKIGTLLSNISSGKSVAAGSVPALNNEKGVLKVSAVSNGSFIFTENKVVDKEKWSLLKLSPKAGDILMTRANTADLVGDVCIVDGNHSNLFLPDKIWKIEPKSSDLNLWIFHLLRYLKYKGLFASLASGTSGSMKNISQKKVLEIDVVQPSNFIAAGIAVHNAYLNIQQASRKKADISVLYKKLLEESLHAQGG